MRELIDLEEQGWHALSRAGDAGRKFYETVLHRDEADFEKNKASGWQQGTQIAIDQFVVHVESMK